MTALTRLEGSGDLVQALPPEDVSACAIFCIDLVDGTSAPGLARALGSKTFDALVWIGGHLP